jgi:hypothetical protein
MIILVTWYVNTIGIETLNRLLFGIALLVALVILFLWKDDTEKVAVAIGTVDRFLKSQQETEKAKEVSEKDSSINPALEYLLKMIKEVGEVQTVEKPKEKEDVPKTEDVY